MISKTIAAALLTTGLMTGAALAQTAAANKDAANAGAAMHRDGEWRASKLVGVNVYNQANEKIGDINDVILDKSGKASNVIIGVGGFLGMGEHNVAVSFDKLKFVNEPVRTSTSTAPANAPATNVDSNARTAADGTVRTTTGTATTTTTTTTTTPTTTPPTRAATYNWYPDHAVYNATKDQLKAMPEFKY